MSNLIIPSQDWPIRTDALTGEEHLLRQNAVGDSSDNPKEERIPTSLVLSYVLSNLPAGNTTFTVTESASDPASTGVTPVSSFWNNTNTGEWFIIDSTGVSYSLGENLPRIVSGSISNTTLTLTRDDSSTITITNVASKNYVDGVTLVDNGGGSYTFTDAGGTTTSFTTGGGGGTAISKYSVSDGNTTGEIWATGLGVTITENAGTGEVIVAIPSGVDMVAINLFLPPSSTDNGAYHIVLDYDGLRDFNTSKFDLKIPLVRTGLDNYANVSRANPANISENGGNSANTVTYGVSAFGGGDGSDLTMTLINFSLGLAQMCRLDFPQI